MTQTKTYKFNLIEASDTFSPDALNANAQTAETQLAALAATEAADKAALEQALAAQKSTLAAADAANKTALEQALAAQKSTLDAADTAIRAALGSGGKTARIAWGSYEGTGVYGKDHPNTLTFDFRPCLVIVGPGPSFYHFMVRGLTQSITDSYKSTLTWSDNSVSWYNGNGVAYQNNYNGTIYHYIAIGESVK